MTEKYTHVHNLTQANGLNLMNGHSEINCIQPPHMPNLDLINNDNTDFQTSSGDSNITHATNRFAPSLVALAKAVNSSSSVSSNEPNSNVNSVGYNNSTEVINQSTRKVNGKPGESFEEPLYCVSCRCSIQRDCQMTLLQCFHIQCISCFKKQRRPTEIFGENENENLFIVKCGECDFLTLESKTKPLIILHNSLSVCQSCLSDDNLPNNLCSECGSLICDRCAQLHGFIIGCAKEKLHPVANEIQNWSHTDKCYQHTDINASKFCITCNYYLCQDCKCPESNKDTLHNIKPINEVMDNCASKMADILQKIVGNFDETAEKLKNKCHKSFERSMKYMNILQRAIDFILKSMSKPNVYEKWYYQRVLPFYVERLNSYTVSYYDEMYQSFDTIPVLKHKNEIEQALNNSINRFHPMTTSKNVESSLNKETKTYNELNEIIANNPSLFKTISAEQFHPRQTIPLSQPQTSIRRMKMVYRAKFGDFGTEKSNFTEPSGIASDKIDRLYVADTNNHRIQVFSTDGCYKFSIGGNGQLLYPNRVAIDHNNGNIVVSERSPSHQIQVFNRNGGFVRRFGSKIIQHPRGLTVDKRSRVIVVECKVMRIIVFSEYGQIISKFNCNKQFQFPNNVAVNQECDEIYISDNRLHNIQVFSYEGEMLRSIGHNLFINYPIGVEIDSKGRLIVADNHNNFNITIFNSQTGAVLEAFESRTKHAQCYDITLGADGELYMSSKDFRVYQYQYGNFGVAYSDMMVENYQEGLLEADNIQNTSSLKAENGTKSSMNFQFMTNGINKPTVNEQKEQSEFSFCNHSYNYKSHGLENHVEKLNLESLKKDERSGISLHNINFKNIAVKNNK
ncbi:MAG: hypothetical protein MHPSP_000094 [Paramarteilia canceri]